MTKTYTYFAATSDYNCSAYGSGAYGSCAAPANSSGGLANTGYDILIPLSLGAAIVIASAIWLLRRVLRRRQTSTSS